MRYFDTSVVFSLYVNEARTPRVDAELRKDPADIIISHWVDIELKSALSLAVRSGRLSPEHAESALSDYRSDRVEGRYRVQVIDASHFAAAEKQIDFGSTLRAGDSLHLAIALIGAYTLVSSDDDLVRIARKLGVETVFIR